MSYKPNKKAVALEYGKNPAPLVTAKGEDGLAEAIIAEAQKQGVRIAVDAQLVEILSQLQIKQEIPDNPYGAVSVNLPSLY